MQKPVLQCIANPCFYRNGSWNYCGTDTNDHPASGQSFWQLLSQCGEYSDNGHYADYSYCSWVQYGTCAGTYQPLPQNHIAESPLQAVMIAGVLMAVKYLVGGSRLLNLAVITYMSSPATFSMQTFLRKKESSAYASTTNSLYCVVSILVYITLAVAG